MKKQKYRVLALVCALVLLVAIIPAPASARGLNDIQAEINEKKAHMEQLEADITKNKANKQAAEKALREYEEQYNLLLALIDEQETLIRGTEEDLDRKTAELSATIASIQNNKELYERRLVAIYDMNTSNVMLSSLFTVTSFTEALEVADALSRISQHDTDLLADLADQQAQYEQQKAELETLIANLTAELEQLQENRDWANGKVVEMQNAIYSYNLSIKASQTEYENTEEEKAALTEEYNRLFKELQERASKEGDGSVRYDGPLTWPVPSRGSNYISSYFGDPRSNTGYHYGIDISAPAGVDIVAAAPGTVITSTWHYSYGYYIVIDHGGGLRTLYAHSSALYVGVGTWVEAGTTIAAIGTTGSSTGNHLHFEVHDKGTRQNPLSSGYLYA